ncbi:MAG: hypothetical protein ACPHRO_14130, partial [Nannocystaceae bacterium]
SDHATVVPCQNHAGDGLHDPSQTHSFRIDGRELWTLIHHVEDVACDVLVYHSHHEVGAYLSRADLRAVRALGSSVRHLVIDVRAGVCVGARLFETRRPSLSRRTGDPRGTLALRELSRFSARGLALPAGPEPWERPLPVSAYNAPTSSLGASSLAEDGAAHNDLLFREHPESSRTSRRRR